MALNLMFSFGNHRQMARNDFCGMNQPDAKRARISSLTSDSENETSDSKDSVYSCQDYETVSAYDSWEISDSDDTELANITEHESRAFRVEFEVASDSCLSYSHYSVSSASEAENVVLEKIAGKVSGDEYAADEEESSQSSRSDISRKIPKKWKCIKCNISTVFPMRYCSSCYRRKKERCVPRPRRKGRKPRMRTVSSRFADLDDNSALVSLNSNETLCSGCGSGKKDGAFIHGKTIHAIFCYSCSKEAFSRRKECPVCRRTIQSVAQIFN